MTPQQRLADFVKTQSEPVQTLYLPVPIVEQWGDKARIFQNNVVSVLKSRPNTNEALLTLLERLELHKVGARGLCLFASADTVQYARLSKRPKTIFSRGPSPLVTPLLKELDDKDSRWVLVMSKTWRALWFVDGDAETDWTSLLDGPDYEDIRQRRNVQDDIFFHSSSRGPSANVNFHALGSDVSAEEDKTTGAFFQETWAAVIQALPYQITRLTVIAPEGTLGAFLKHAPDTMFDITRIPSGDGLSALSQDWSDQKDQNTKHAAIVPISEAKKKADHGRLEILTIPDQSRVTAIVTSDHQGGSENLHLRIANAEDKIFTYNEMAIDALKTGAQITFAPVDRRRDKSVGKVTIKQRW